MKRKKTKQEIVRKMSHFPVEIRVWREIGWKSDHPQKKGGIKRTANQHLQSEAKIFNYFNLLKSTMYVDITFWPLRHMILWF